MKDRIPTEIVEIAGKPGEYAIRYGEYDAEGNLIGYRYFAPADEPIEKGTPINKATLLKDATAALYGLGADAVPDDVFNKLVTPIGDIKTTVRTDLGEDWLLCNGGVIYKNDYPELFDNLLSGAFVNYILNEELSMSFGSVGTGTHSTIFSLYDTINNRCVVCSGHNSTSSGYRTVVGYADGSEALNPSAWEFIYANNPTGRELLPKRIIYDNTHNRYVILTYDTLQQTRAALVFIDASSMSVTNTKVIQSASSYVKDILFDPDSNRYVILGAARGVSGTVRLVFVDATNFSETYIPDSVFPDTSKMYDMYRIGYDSKNGRYIAVGAWREDYTTKLYAYSKSEGNWSSGYGSTGYYGNDIKCILIDSDREVGIIAHGDSGYVTLFPLDNMNDWTNIYTAFSMIRDLVYDPLHERYLIVSDKNFAYADANNPSEWTTITTPDSVPYKSIMGIKENDNYMLAGLSSGSSGNPMLIRYERLLPVISNPDSYAYIKAK